MTPNAAGVMSLTSYVCRAQLEDLEAAKAVTEEAVQEAKAQLDAVKAEAETLRAENEGCMDAIRDVGARREVSRCRLLLAAFVIGGSVTCNARSVITSSMHRL